jgi:histone-lysine N-methyltransferase SETMAR
MKNHDFHFLGQKSILMVDFMPPGATVHAAAYCDTLIWPLRAIQNKRRGILSRVLCLLDENAWPHYEHVTTTLLEKFKWDISDHPPYSPYLALSDFNLFPQLKKHLAGKKIDDNDVQEFMTWFKGQAAYFCNLGIQKLLPRFNKCLNNGGDYTEK